MRKRAESGLAMVQVLVMSVLLMILATGVMRMVFGSHVLVSRQITSDERKALAEACMAEKNELWAGAACPALDLTNCGGDKCCVYNVGGTNYTITAVCTAAGANTEVKYTINW